MRWHQETSQSGLFDRCEFADLDLDLDLDWQRDSALDLVAVLVNKYSPPLTSQSPPAMASPFPTRLTICHADLTAPLRSDCSI